MASGVYVMVARVPTRRKFDDLIESLYAIVDLARFIFRGGTATDDRID